MDESVESFLQNCPFYHEGQSPAEDGSTKDFIMRLNEGDDQYAEYQSKIFSALSGFLVTNNDDSSVSSTSPLSLDHFTEKEKGAVACGHVFRKGELVYRCKQCGNDDTCVLCSKCFDPESHNGHDVSYSISGSGGCCDCGDPEAWKNEIYCKVHGKTLLGEIMEEEIDLRESKFAHLEASMLAVMKQAVDFMGETFLELFYAPVDEVFIPGGNPSSSYVVVLYNDEFHNFDQVNDALMASTACSMIEAQKIAEIVDKRVILISNPLLYFLILHYNLLGS